MNQVNRIGTILGGLIVAGCTAASTSPVCTTNDKLKITNLRDQFVLAIAVPGDAAPCASADLAASIGSPSDRVGFRMSLRPAQVKKGAASELPAPAAGYKWLIFQSSGPESEREYARLLQALETPSMDIQQFAFQPYGQCPALLNHTSAIINLGSKGAIQATCPDSVRKSAP